MLSEIDGIGKIRRMALLDKFGTLDGIMNADINAIAEIDGISLALAAKIKTYLQENL